MPGETITKFYIRTDALMQNLIKMDPGCVLYVKQDQIAAFRKALLRSFNSCLHRAKKKIPAEVYWCALRFIRDHPQCKLTDEDLRKEIKQTVNMALSTSPPPTKTTPVEKGDKNAGSFRCYNCQGLGHIARHCNKKGTRCENCGWNNHRTHECTRAPRRQCMSCGMYNHFTADCRSSRSGYHSEIKQLQLQTQNVEQSERARRKEDDTVGSVEHYRISKEFGLIAAEVKIKTQDEGYTKVTAMIDTGASVSLIEQQFLVERKIAGKLITKETVDIFAINQDHVRNEGKVEVVVQVGTEIIRQEMILVSHYKLPTPIVLGVDYLIQNKIGK